MKSYSYYWNDRYSTKHKEDLTIGSWQSKEININKVSSSATAYFEEILFTNRRIQEIKKLKEENKKIIGIFCNFVPQELIYSCGAIPIRLCAGTLETIPLTEEIVGRDICPLIKSTFGSKFFRDSYISLCDLVIIPTTCDGKKKLGEILNNYLPVWMLELPQRKNLDEVITWLCKIRDLKAMLEDFCRCRITLDKMRKAVILLQKRTAVFRRFYNIKRKNPHIISGKDVLIITQTSFYDDSKRWIKHMEVLCEQVELTAFAPKEKTSSSKFRILLAGAPLIWPNFKLVDLIEESSDLTIAADELCSGMQYLYHPAEVGEWTGVGVLGALATKYLLPSICPCFVESNDRIDKLLNLIEEFKIDGVVHHSLRLCQLYDIELYRIKQVLKDRRIPIISIHTDYSQEDTAQIKTRLEAFFEMLKTYKKS